MQILTIYGLKNCDTCKKALKALKNDAGSPVFIDIRAETDLPAKLPEWLQALGAPALVNKRSTTWRTLTDSDKKKIESGDAEALLIEHPTLIKRPVIESSAGVTVGWNDKTEQTHAKPA